MAPAPIFAVMPLTRLGLSRRFDELKQAHDGADAPEARAEARQNMLALSLVVDFLVTEAATDADLAQGLEKLNRREENPGEPREPFEPAEAAAVLKLERAIDARGWLHRRGLVGHLAQRLDAAADEMALAKSATARERGRRKGEAVLLINAFVLERSNEVPALQAALAKQMRGDAGLSPEESDALGDLTAAMTRLEFAGAGSSMH